MDRWPRDREGSQIAATSRRRSSRTTSNVLQGDALVAGPPSALYRLRKLARRHRAAAAAALAAGVVLVLSGLAVGLAWLRAREAETATRRQLIGSFVAQGTQKVDAGDSLGGLLYFVRALELETDRQRERAHRIRIGETLQRSPALTDLWRHEGAITMLAVRRPISSSPAAPMASSRSDGWGRASCGSCASAPGSFKAA